jgi:hypothetical protein
MFADHTNLFFNHHNLHIVPIFLVAAVSAALARVTALCRTYTLWGNKNATIFIFLITQSKVDRF